MQRVRWALSVGQVVGWEGGVGKVMPYNLYAVPHNIQPMAGSFPPFISDGLPTISEITVAVGW